MLSKLGRGALAGLAATIPMSGVVALGYATGLIANPPPRGITANVKRRLGLGAHERSPQFNLTWMAAHLGYGVGCGVVYALVRPLLPTAALPTGLLYGLLVWGSSYLGALPALDLYPPPQHDTPTRAKLMVVAHLVFGAVLGLLVGSPRQRRRPATVKQWSPDRFEASARRMAS